MSIVSFLPNAFVSDSRSSGYGVEFEIEQCVKMAKMLKMLKGKAIVSLNDHPKIREIFARYETDTVPTTYCVGGCGKAVDLNEVIICS